MQSSPSADQPDVTAVHVDNGRQYGTKSLVHPLFEAARKETKNIDRLLRTYLHDDTFPKELELYMHEYVSVTVTPGLYGHSSPNRPQWYYANCLINGTILGRAFALLSTPVRPPRSLLNLSDFPFAQLPAELRLHIFEYYKADLEQRQRYWDIMTRIFIKALWSGPVTEDGARYTTGIILLSCGHALSNAAPLLRGRGARWVWWDDRFSDPEHTWGWDKLQAGIMRTVHLPRSNTNIEDLREWRERIQEPHDGGLYVSKQTLEVLDLAREHLRTDERDWTPPELSAKFLSHMYERSNEAKAIWEDVGFVPSVYEECSNEEDQDAASLLR